MQILIVITGVCLTQLIPNKRGIIIRGMTKGSAQHTAKAEFSKMSEAQNQVSVDHGLSMTKITKQK